MYLTISLGLAFLILKIYGKLFFRFTEQKDTVDRLEIATNIANIALWEYDPETKNLIWSNNIQTILETDSDVSYYDFLNNIPNNEKKIVEDEF